MQNSHRPARAWTGLLVILVLLNIALQLINASIIKYATQLVHAKTLLVFVLLGVVAALSFGRFMIWGALHKRFPVSIAYPATALFFPCVVMLAYAFGERVTTPQTIGAGLVTLGVVLLLRPAAKPGRGA